MIAPRYRRHSPSRTSRRRGSKTNQRAHSRSPGRLGANFAQRHSSFAAFPEPRGSRLVLVRNAPGPTRLRAWPLSPPIRVGHVDLTNRTHPPMRSRHQSLRTALCERTLSQALGRALVERAPEILSGRLETKAP